MRIYKESYMIDKICDPEILEVIITDPKFYDYIKELYDFKDNPFQEGVDCRQMSIDVCNGINMCMRSTAMARPLHTSYKKEFDKGHTISNSPCESLMFDFHNRVYVLEGDIIAFYDVNKDTDYYSVITEVSNSPSVYKAMRIRDYILKKAESVTAFNRL